MLREVKGTAKKLVNADIWAGANGMKSYRVAGKSRRGNLQHMQWQGPIFIGWLTQAPVPRTKG